MFDPFIIILNIIKNMSQLIIKSDIICSFDKVGNIYFASINTPNDLYELIITKKNMIECEKYVNNSSNNVKLIQGELVSLKSKETLKGKIISEIEENGHDSDSDNELCEDVIKKYYYEDLEFNEYVNKEQTDEPYFSFNVPKDYNLKNIVYDRDDILALYDTIIYNGVPSESNLIAKTTLINDNVIYRLCVYTSGDIKFRSIGSNDLNFQIENVKDEIKLIYSQPKQQEL